MGYKFRANGAPLQELSQFTHISVEIPEGPLHEKETFFSFFLRRFRILTPLSPTEGRTGESWASRKG
jgi:hypothetical protein